MLNESTPLERLRDPIFDSKKIELWVKREDLIHSEIQGNKWRKLKYNLQAALGENKSGVLTFGGAYSNHIAATAAACEHFKLKSVGIIRGNELNIKSNATLRYATSKGMSMKFVDRATYRQLTRDSSSLSKSYENYYILPEGGTNSLAIKGCKEIVGPDERAFDYVLLPVGTGGTMAGVIAGMRGKGMVVGISCLKGEFIIGEISKLLNKFQITYSNYRVETDYHFGGYGKSSDELIELINKTKKVHNLLLEPIYTGKMYFALRSMVQKDFFMHGSKIVMIHTGGIQGINGFNEKSTKKILL